MARLYEEYSGVIFSYGAEGEYGLGDLAGNNIHSSKSIISWYNSHLGYFDYGRKMIKNWGSLRNLVVVGNGNVALDVSRMVCSSPDRLRQTDVNPQFEEFLQGSAIKNVTVVGRRGLVQSSFAIKEMRDICNIEGIRCFVVKEDLDASLNECTEIELSDSHKSTDLHKSRLLNKKLKLMTSEKFTIINHSDLESLYNDQSDKKTKNIIFRFLLGPKSTVTSQGDNLEKLVCDRMRLTGDVPYNQKASVDSHAGREEIPCDMIVTCVGYYSLPIEGTSKIFDQKNRVMSNSHGCVLVESQSDKFMMGVYCSGWVKTGARGIIDATMKGSEETYVNLKHHLKNHRLVEKEDPISEILASLEKSGKKTVSFDDWLRIDELEREKGKASGRIRLKFNNEADLMAVL